MKKQKFRVWDEDNQEMIYEIGITPEGIAYSIPDYAEEPDQFNYYPNCFITQFTGLHDKNGNEIYIGDLVKSDDVEIPYEVTINDFSQVPVIDNEYGQMELYKCHNVIEVIGNSYELIDWNF